MANLHLDSSIEFWNSASEDTTATVFVEGSDFGRTTRVFGVQYRVKWQEFQASFYVGRGGNNTRPLGNFAIKLPPDFIRRTVLQAVLFLEGSAIRAGIESYSLRYVNRPPTLRTEDVRVQLFQGNLHMLPWPGEPNHDKEVASHAEEQWRKLHPIICLSPDQARAEAQKREAIASVCTEWKRLHPPVHSLRDLRLQKKSADEREEMKKRSLPLIRVNDLASELNVRSNLILNAVCCVGIRRKITHSASLGNNEADKVRSYLETSRSA